MARNPGDEDILWRLHYSHIAEWTGLTVATVRTYAQQGKFDKRDIESVLSWVNDRRARRGLPPIGQAHDDLTPDETTTSTPPQIVAPHIPSVYNPLTGGFDL